MPNIKSNESVKTLTLCELRNKNVEEQKCIAKRFSTCFEGCLLLLLQIQKVSIYSYKSLTLAEGEAARGTREGSHRQSGRVGQRRRDTGDGNIDIILKKRQ